MTSLTQLCRDLSIGKPRLYGILERLDIQPEQVGNKRLLDNDQVAKVRDALGSKTDRKPTETGQNRPLIMEVKATKMNLLPRYGIKLPT
jgi:hypothetical protein